MDWKIPAFVLVGLLIGLGVGIGSQYVMYQPRLQNLQSVLDGVQSQLNQLDSELNALQTYLAKYSYTDTTVHLGANSSINSNSVLDFSIGGYRRITFSVSSISSLNIDIRVRMGHFFNLAYLETQWTTSETVISYKGDKPYQNTFDVMGPQLQFEIVNYANQDIDVRVSTYATA